MEDVLLKHMQIKRTYLTSLFVYCQSILHQSRQGAITQEITSAMLLFWLVASFVLLNPLDRDSSSSFLIVIHECPYRRLIVSRKFDHK